MSRGKLAYLKDLGELNDISTDIYEDSYDHDKGITTIWRQLFEKHYGYDITSGPGPYAAVVLKVLSGPQIKNEATTGGRANTDTLNIDGFTDPFVEKRIEAGKGLPVIVKAKVPEFDADIDWPHGWLHGDMSDEVRIDAHGTFFQFKEDETLSQINAKSIIWVTYKNKNCERAFDGRPTGKIIGFHTPGLAADIKKFISPKLAMNPECNAAVNLIDPAGGLYVGHTDPDPASTIGPPIRKIKGHIKTGIYGNGTPQTKVHFSEALNRALESAKHGIPKAAPGPKNAFIWIGTLKNNGYMDLLDRPISQGRETIIYAPMTLDLTAPIEIKYYFHDNAGFGHAHIDGPLATSEQALGNALIPGNDFREKIAPGIKDLNKNGRNYILVIPEMSYSRGYGTKNGNSGRINKLSSGESVVQGSREGETIRTKNSDSRTAIKNYLNKLPIETNKNLLHITPLREREFATFDGSFTGGKFGNFHYEVLEVLESHLGTIKDKIEFISFLADGLGAVALASIVNEVKFSSTQTDGRLSFKNVLLAKKIRIDYVTDQKLDSPSSYGYYFGGLAPSTAMWKYFLLERSEVGQGYTEFNYIARKAVGVERDENSFFEHMGKLSQYKKHAAALGGKGERKFSFYAAGNAFAPVGEGVFGDEIPGPESFISFHVAPRNIKKRVGYAFSMVNDFLANFQNLPQKSDTNASLRESFSEVPDHAYALSTKPSVGDLEKILKKQGNLAEQINYFEGLLTKIAEISWFDFSDELCNEPQYKAFCEDGSIKTGKDSEFLIHYEKYLENKKKYMEALDLAFYEQEIQYRLNSRKALTDLKEIIEEASRDVKSDIQKEKLSTKWKSLQQFDKDNFAPRGNGTSEYIIPGDPENGYISYVAGMLSTLHSYPKVLAKLESAISTAGPEPVGKPKNCEPKSGRKRTLGKVKTPGARSDVPGNNCSDIKELSTPNTFEDLAKMIPYWPKSSEFTPFGGKKTKKKTKIHLVPGYRVSKFKYSCRIAGGQITKKESPFLWACFTDVLQSAWESACQESNYFPFEITSGLRGSGGTLPPTPGTTAYPQGISLHSYGLAFDLDPFIAGYSNNPNRAVNSVYTGAWTPGLIDVHGQTLWNLGVFKHSISDLKKNAFQEENRPRLAENWRDAPSHYRGGGESGGARQKYIKIMNSAKGNLIVPGGANPTLWVIRFCELSGMRWGNAFFLKKRWRGGKIWSKEEKDQISSIFGIPRIVDRVQAISWKDTHIEDHMHFHYWGRKSLIPWSDTKRVRDKAEK